jgi:hypothetical protein
MVRRWIWISFALISLDAVHAQQDTKTQLTIQVTDVTGAFVPKALIEIGAESNGAKLAAEADGVGKGEFELPIGNYHLLVKSPGFCPYKGPMEVLKQQSQIITAKLQVDSCPGPCAGPCVTVSSEPEIQTTLTVVVTDQTGAIIPGAHIAATNQATGSRVEATADATGQAIVDLDQGIYKLRVTAPGFQGYLENEVEAKAEMHRVVALRAGIGICEPCMDVRDVPEIPLERQPIAADIPLIPVPQLVLPAKPLHPKHSSIFRNHT